MGSNHQLPNYNANTLSTEPKVFDNSVDKVLNENWHVYISEIRNLCILSTRKYTNIYCIDGEFTEKVPFYLKSTFLSIVIFFFNYHL